MQGPGEGWEYLQWKWGGEGERAELNEEPRGKSWRVKVVAVVCIFLFLFVYLSFSFVVLCFGLCFAPAQIGYLLWANFFYGRECLACIWNTIPLQYRLTRKGESRQNGQDYLLPPGTAYSPCLQPTLLRCGEFIPYHTYTKRCFLLMTCLL